jgi:CheY-like chemotaxis protein
MESIGHLTGGIAHDFNNILGAIMGYAELTHNIMASKPESYTQLQPYIQQILNASERAKQLIAQMLVFSRLSPEMQSGQKQVVMLSPIVKEVINLLRSSIPAKISLNYQLPENDVHVRMQPVHLHQVLLNLGINARDAIGEYGDIKFGVTLRDRVQGVCTSCNQSIDGRFVDISVKDSGSGIAAHILHSIFDPFFTTKAVGKGTGMGLSVVHGLVHEAGGHIQVESAEGSGTTFHILLPVIDAANTGSQTNPVPSAIPAPTLQGRRLMVIDDEKAMTSMLKDVLEIQGAQVTVYNNPLSALNTLSNKMNEFDLVITDESMPELSGMHFSKMLLNIRPGMPIILCTGYSETATAEAASALGIAAFMYKPLDTSALIRKISALTRPA